MKAVWKNSVGVARQWCGRLGEIAHCPGAVSLGDVSGAAHTLVDMRRYLPKAWTHEKARLDTAGVPHDRRGDRSRHQWALERVQDRGARLPQAWMAGDDERGRPSWFRRWLDRLGERSLARVARAAHRSAACLPRRTSDAGLADAAVRHGTGWHPHQTLSLIAPWFFVTETRRGKKWTPAMTVPHMRAGIALILSLAYQCGTRSRMRHKRERRLQRNERARFYSWKQHNRLPPLNVDKRRF